MSTIKSKAKYFVGIIVIFICCLNINVITDIKDNAKLSLSIITGLASADGELPNSGELLICMDCEPAPGQTGVRWICIFVDWGQPSCFYIPCGYGICG